MATDIPNIVSTTEAAEELGITDSLVRRYIREGRINAFRLGSRYYGIDRKSLDAFKKIPREVGKHNG